VVTETLVQARTIHARVDRQSVVMLLCSHAIRTKSIREVVMLTTGTDTRARPRMACSECNNLLVAPKSSAYVSNHEIRHVWSCES
jgi:hypothetical protein